MFLLDTMVISELRRQRPHGAVLAWLKGVDDADLRLSAVTLGEIQAGIEMTRKQNPKRADELEVWLDAVAASWNVLPMDGVIFRRWAQLMHGRSDDLIEDAMIAATAAVHGLTVVTRNVRDFRYFGVKTLDPFKAV
jgi:predicted nucleic acid-binding protein